MGAGHIQKYMAVGTRSSDTTKTVGCDVLAGTIVVGLRAWCARARLRARPEPYAPSVLILYQAGAGLQAYSDISEAFRGTVNRDAKSLVAVYEENLDLSRFSGPAYQQTVERYLDEKYRDIAIGVVVAVGDKAFEYALHFQGPALAEDPNRLRGAW